MHNYIYISIFKRELTWIVDVLIVSLLFGLITGGTEADWVIWIGIVIIFLYFVLMQYHFGNTIGQKIFKLKIVSTVTGERPSLRSILIREITGLTAWTGIGAVLAYFTYSYYSGFYWDRWTSIKVIPTSLELAEFNRMLDEDREKLFPENSN